MCAVVSTRFARRRRIYVSTRLGRYILLELLGLRVASRRASVLATLQPAFRLWFYPADVSDDPDTQAILNAATCRKIESVWARIDAHLLAQGPYLLGAEFSAADLMLIMLMRWSRNMPRPATEWPALHQYAARLKARTSWKTS